ncbi:hypothetical protein XELAEV_18036804mg [Xenopus laevis]|uniref:Uncharacterized protein n=1 Tax=Xenopus laevis TaxID=8355 RepID=A0A974CAZ7_XENLA|nr:hypothetical protein XELAEV_18036804mg [Xenopus laevis]
MNEIQVSTSFRLALMERHCQILQTAEPKVINHPHSCASKHTFGMMSIQNKLNLLPSTFLRNKIDGNERCTKSVIFGLGRMPNI